MLNIKGERTLVFVQAKFYGFSLYTPPHNYPQLHSLSLLLPLGFEQTPFQNELNNLQVFT
jgi:hypothetical protein